MKKKGSDANMEGVRRLQGKGNSKVVHESEIAGAPRTHNLALTRLPTLILSSPNPAREKRTHVWGWGGMVNRLCGVCSIQKKENWSFKFLVQVHFFGEIELNRTVIDG